jgi:hypothetical protein
MRRRFLAVASALLVVAVSLGAQAKPNFSGKWVMDPPPAGGANAGGGRGGGGGAAAGFQPGFGAEFTVTQNDKTLSISRGQGTPLVYKLDGSESKNTVTRNGEQQEQTAKATWEGDKLVIATDVNFQGNTAEQRRVLSLENGNLVIEQTNPGRNGGAATKIVYKKG